MAPANPHNFSCLLQERFVPADANWTYRVDNLPKKTTANAAGLMKVISLVSNSEKQEMTLRYTSSEPNRAIDRKQLDRYLSISFEGFRLQNPLETKDAKRTSMRLRDSADYKIQLLRKGITLNDTTYRFFGHSNSQLKTGTCYLYAGKPEEISAIIEGFGSLQGIKTVAKKAKRIGLLFSAAKIATQLQPERCEDIPDVTQGDYIFTDGCGLISKHFAKLLVQRAQIRFRNQSFTPSVFQIRYRGYKGVLTLEPKLPVRTLVQFRDSMRKFRGGDDLSFAVVDYARPYAFGYLNDEVILLLNSLGVGEQVLLRKQREHLGFLQSVPHNALSAFRFLSQINETILAERVLLEGLDAVSATLQKLVNRETSKMINKRGEARSRILIPQSRLLFGICDPRDVLRNGECAIRVTMAADGVAKTIVNTEVLVTRNPCLHPGDLRKFRAVQYPQLDHLVDCIVFSNKGRRPSADLMSGGDLDGDKFLVCWDPDLIPAVLSEPAAYKGPREPVTFGPITDDHRLVYFASYTNASLGRAKNLFLDWAKVKGPMAPECQELNHLFSRCVDGNRISIPSHLLKAPEMPPNAPRFILDVLHDNATKLIKERVAPNSALAGSSFDAIELLMSRTDIAFSEFELFQMALQWCRAHERSVTELFDFFDFNQLSDDQRSWVMGRLAPTEGVPSLVLNALVSSSILEPSDLRHFNLEYQGIRWKRTYSSATDRLDLFLRNVSRAMELFERKLIVFRVDARLTLALYVPKRINMREESVVDDTCRLFAFPHSQGEETRYRRAVPTRIGYRIYYNSTGLQLYQTQKRDTWVFLTQPGANDASYVAIEDRGDKRRQRQITLDQGENADCISSIALNKFSSSLARHIGRVNRSPIQAAEVYVISNRDTRSLQVLDQWIHFVDTRETLPLFDTVASDYKLPSLKDVDWSCETKLHVDVVKHQDFTRLSSVTNVQDVLDWLFQRDEKTLLRHIYNYLLPLENGTFRPGGSFRVLGVLIDFLRRAPSLVLAFTSIATWKDLPETARFFQENALDLLIAVVSCANEMEGLVLGPFQRILSQMRFMSLSTFGKIVETIALAIELPEVALDLLSGALELESSRLLTHRPAIVRHYIKNCIGIAMEHIEEAKESQNFRKDQFELHREPGSNIVASRVRIDAQSSVPLAARDHVRLEVIGMPTNSLRATPYTMHALVEKSEPGLVSFECVHPPPAYLEHCKWRVKNCGSFVTTRTMFEALNIFIMEPEVSCGIQNQLLCLPQETDPIPHIQYPFAPRDDLNPSQNKAISTLLDCSLTCLWGPPGTGKTHTLAVALEELLSWNLDDKILVTAPTHNAVDNVLRAFLANMARRKKALPEVLRVSTEIRKVGPDLRSYTCDAMLGKDLNDNPAGRRKAQKQVDRARVVFTTCIGASLGLLRCSRFPIVIIDEASQQTEPQSLVPLTKGCAKAILVGDHVQLRATVHPHAQLQSFDVSLFERLYLAIELSQYPPTVAQKVMLDTQYRMHASICAFSSREFYADQLRTAVPDSTRQLPPAFPWPLNANGTPSHMVFTQCDHMEDLGGRSKNNSGQVNLARQICQLLVAPAPSNTTEKAQGEPASFKVAALTPYTACAEALRSALPPSVDVSSIDGYQGREADIVVFVTVRCNVHGEIGFLKDLRRLNVAVTRAKAGLVVVGDKKTLAGPDRMAVPPGIDVGTGVKVGVNDSIDEERRVWGRLIKSCAELNLELETTAPGKP